MKRLSPFLFLAFLIFPPLPVRSQTQNSPLAGQAEAPTKTDFKHLVAQLQQRRVASTEKADDEAARLQESALQILDGYVLESLNSASGPQLDALSQRMTGLVDPSVSVGQGYAIAPLGGTPAIYALAANFGSSGPSAVRLYSGGPQQYRMAGRIDVVAQPDYFDDHLVLLPMTASASSAEVVFVTITGRTDEYLTGVFAAWRFTGDHVEELWATDLMPHSSYQMKQESFEITYCSEADEDNPQSCRRMARERYAWVGAAWKRVEQTDLGPPKS